MSLLPTASAETHIAPPGAPPAGGVPDTNPTTED
jgi:hypothetical protein